MCLWLCTLQIQQDIQQVPYLHSFVYFLGRTCCCNKPYSDIPTVQRDSCYIINSTRQLLMYIINSNVQKEWIDYSLNTYVAALYSTKTFRTSCNQNDTIWIVFGVNNYIWWYEICISACQGRLVNCFWYICVIWKSELKPWPLPPPKEKKNNKKQWY